MILCTPLPTRSTNFRRPDDYQKCPICGQKHVSILGKKSLMEPWDAKFNLTWSRCSYCSHAFIWHYLSDQNLSDIYSTNYSSQTDIGWAMKRGASQFKTLQNLSLITSEMTQLNVLEQGCAHGIFLNHFVKLSDTLYCLEPDSDVAAEVIKGQNREKLTLIRSVEVDDSIVPDNSIDFWLGSHVIEHFADPNRFVFSAYKKLKMGGIFFQEFPLQVDLPRADKSKDCHLNYYSGKSIHQILVNHGFCQIAMYKITNLLNILKDPSYWPDVSETEIHKTVKQQTHGVFRVVYKKCEYFHVF